MIDPQVEAEAKRDDVFAGARLAKSCLRLNGEKRPTMKEVSVELEGLTKSQHPLCYSETKCCHSHLHALLGTLRKILQMTTFTWRWSLSQSRHQHSLSRFNFRHTIIS